LKISPAKKAAVSFLAVLAAMSVVFNITSRQASPYAAPATQRGPGSAWTGDLFVVKITCKLTRRPAASGPTT
jgi:hypothetical protein